MLIPKIHHQRANQGLPSGLSGKESSCQCRGHRFDPWSRNIPQDGGKLGPRATVVGVDPRRESRGSAGKTGSAGMD